MTQQLTASAFQVLLLLVFAPLLTGIIKKTKALLQTRKGSSVLQPYLDLYKFLQKESVVSEHTSWIFRATPYVYLAAVLVAAVLIPAVSTMGAFGFTGDVILVVYLFALARFALTLAGLDAGSAFGGMASSREMAISSIAEPAMMLSLLTMAVTAGTTNLTGMMTNLNQAGLLTVGPAHLLSFVAFFIVAIAETGRIPVDNPDTHLELTMVHEGMLLEYSSKPLAVLVLGASLKQLLILILLANIFFPWGIATTPCASSLGIAVPSLLGKVILLGIAMAIVETSFAKMRLFKVPDLLMGSFLLGLLGLISKFAFRG